MECRASLSMEERQEQAGKCGLYRGPGEPERLETTALPPDPAACLPKYLGDPGLWCIALTVVAREPWTCVLCASKLVARIPMTWPIVNQPSSCAHFLQRARTRTKSALLRCDQSTCTSESRRKIDQNCPALCSSLSGLVSIERAASVAICCTMHSCRMIACTPFNNVTH